MSVNLKKVTVITVLLAACAGSLAFAQQFSADGFGSSAGADTGIMTDKYLQQPQPSEEDFPPIEVDSAGNIKIPDPNLPPTKDGSKRGTAAIIQIPREGEELDPNADRELIFLYYENFAITRNFGGTVGCDVRFVVLTTLNQRLTNLSVKLKWPGISTSLSFNDVNPNVATYFDYALLGEGCYTMDKIPNIIVNRCRIKGVSQQDCARKIRWLTK